MKSPLDYFKYIPKEFLEWISFAAAVLFGTVYKVLKQNETGVKITVKKYLTEAISSFFVALIVFAVFDQYFHFNQLFILMMCSLAGSMSSKFHKHIEDFLDFIFDTTKNAITRKVNKL